MPNPAVMGNAISCKRTGLFFSFFSMGFAINGGWISGENAVKHE